MQGNIIFRILTLPFLQTAIIFITATSINALRQDEVSMGTTILAVRYEGGVVVGADTRTSVSGYVSNRYAAKLTFVLDRNVDDFVKVSSKSKKFRGGGDDFSTCVICRSGSAADTQRLASVVRTELVSRQLLYGIRGTVSHVAALLRNVLVDNAELSASLICAGYDHERGDGVLYAIGPGGTAFEEREWAAGGSGSSYILGHLDSRYLKKEGNEDVGDAVRRRSSPLLRSEEEALEFVSNAIGLAMERDGSSGGFIRMYVIDRFGKRFVSMMPNGRTNRVLDGNGEKGMRSASGGVPLRNFAPAATRIKASNVK